MSVDVVHPFTGRLEFELRRSLVPICTVDVIIRLDVVQFSIAMTNIATVERAGLKKWLMSPTRLLIVDDIKLWVDCQQLHLTVGTSDPYVIADEFLEDLASKL